MKYHDMSEKFGGFPAKICSRNGEKLEGSAQIGFVAWSLHAPNCCGWATHVPFLQIADVTHIYKLFYQSLLDSLYYI